MYRLKTRTVKAWLYSFATSTAAKTTAAGRKLLQYASKYSITASKEPAASIVSLTTKTMKARRTRKSTSAKSYGLGEIRCYIPIGSAKITDKSTRLSMVHAVAIEAPTSDPVTVAIRQWIYVGDQRIDDVVYGVRLRGQS